MSARAVPLQAGLSLACRQCGQPWSHSMACPWELSLDFLRLEADGFPLFVAPAEKRKECRVSLIFSSPTLVDGNQKRQGIEMVSGYLSPIIFNLALRKQYCSEKEFQNNLKHPKSGSKNYCPKKKTFEIFFPSYLTPTSSLFPLFPFWKMLFLHLLFFLPSYQLLSPQ